MQHAAEYVEIAVQGPRDEEEAKAHAAKIIDKAEKDIALEKAQALKDVREETADLAVMIAEKLLQDNIDAKNQDALVDGLIEDLEKNHV